MARLMVLHLALPLLLHAIWLQTCRRTRSAGMASSEVPKQASNARPPCGSRFQEAHSRWQAAAHMHSASCSTVAARRRRHGD
mgnify:CR=1 FL=1